MSWDFTLYREAMVARHGGKGIIIREVKGADKLEKTEVSKCWKSQ